MSTRKLQQEFDKTNKKISEGLVSFDEIYEKLLSTEIASQREKLESDLKKEIKKLQRSRDQLKQWLGDNLIKLDKSLLSLNRSKIEHAMDLFKDLEKLLKIKQFSNEGLELLSKSSKYNRFNPEDVKKQASVDYLADIIDQLNMQNEALEVEIHTLLSKKKSATTTTAIDDIKYSIKRNNMHLTNLEKILRLIENENLDPTHLDEIKEDLEYYVENNQEDDYVEYDDFYDILDLAKGEDLDVYGSISQIDPIPGAKEEKDAAPPSTSVSASSSSSKKTDDYNTASTSATSTLNSKKDVEKSNSGTEKSPQKPSAPPGISTSSLNSPVKVTQNHSPQVSPISPTKSVIPTRPPGFDKPETKSETPLKANYVPKSETPKPPGISPIHSPKSTEAPSNSIQSRVKNPLPYSSISLMLENSLLNCPDSYDSEKPRQYLPVNIHPSSIDYPQEPMYELNSSNLMRKFDNDTLFYCFYYSEGADSLAKWNSAKELSRRGWVFNKESKQWFLKDLKDLKNKDVNDELLNYKYFDYEKTWLVRRKENFNLSENIRESFV